MKGILDRIERALAVADRDLAAGRRWPLVLFLAAFALKAAYVLQTANALQVLVPIMDARYYDQMASDIARGNVIRHEAFFMGPLYPYFLAIVYSIVGRDFLVVRLLQAAGGALTVVLVFLIGRRVFRPSAAMIGAVLLLLYGAMTFYESELLMEWLGALLNCTALWLLVRARDSSVRSYAAAGAVLGVSALARASILVFALFVVVWMLWIDGGRRRVARTLAFTGALVVALSPALIHNLVVSRVVVPVTSNAGMNFYIGNSHGANGAFVPIRGVDETDDVTTIEYVERTMGREVTPSEVSKFWFHRAMNDVRKDSSRAVRLMARKAAMFFNGYEIPQIEAFELHAAESPWLRVLFVRLWFVLPLAVLGMVLSVRSDRARLLSGYVLTYAASIVVFFVTGRYRSQIAPVLCLFAGYALASLLGGVRQPRWLAAAMIGLAAFSFATNPAIFQFDQDVVAFREHVHRGRRLGELKSYAPAIREIDAAIAMFPKQAEGYVQRAIVHAENGDDFKAIEDYGRALKIDPAAPSVHYDLAQALRRVNLSKEAVLEYELAIRYDPDMLQAYNNMGVTLREMKRFDDAAATFRKVTEIAPNFVKGYNNLGACYAEMGRYEDAIAIFAETTRRFPDYANGFKNLAMAYASQKRIQPALDAMRRYAALEPSDAAAKEVIRKLEIAAAADTSSAD